jgi:hypothetical protein
MFYRVLPGMEDLAKEIIHRVAYNVLSLSHHPYPEDQGDGDWAVDYHVGYGLWLLLRRDPKGFRHMALEGVKWRGVLAYEPVFRSWDESEVNASLGIGHGADAVHIGIVPKK